MGSVDDPADDSASALPDGPLIERVRGRRVYLDANVFIYALEGIPSLKVQVLPLFAALDAGEIDAVTSELTLAEVLVVPYRIEDAGLAERYERLLTPRVHLARVPASLSVWRSAARLRAQTRLRLPNAVHLATAEAEGSTLVVTGDKQLAKASMIPAALVAEPTV